VVTPSAATTTTNKGNKMTNQEKMLNPEFVKSYTDKSKFPNHHLLTCLMNSLSVSESPNSIIICNEITNRGFDGNKIKQKIISICGKTNTYRFTESEKWRIYYTFMN
tara:strand:+ start:2209 stop:2529 length:321 start_codon:yes stop_codon:yes gene_type:complete